MEAKNVLLHSRFFARMLFNMTERGKVIQHFATRARSTGTNFRISFYRPHLLER